MGYAARRNPTAQHFATPEGMSEARAQREAAVASAKQAEANRRQREFDRLVAAVQAPDAAQRFSPVRLGMARTYLASRGIVA